MEKNKLQMDDIHPELTVQFPEHRREFISLLQANYQYIPCFRTCQIFSGKLLFVCRLESPDALCRVLVIGILVSSSPWALFCVSLPENSIRVFLLDCFVRISHGKLFFSQEICQAEISIIAFVPFCTPNLMISL